MNKLSPSQRDSLLCHIGCADFERGRLVEQQLLNGSHESRNHVLSGVLTNQMRIKWKNQSKESREKYKGVKKPGIVLEDVRDQSQHDAVDYLRRCQGMDMVLGLPLGHGGWSWVQDRVIDGDSRYLEKETIFIHERLNDMAASVHKNNCFATNDLFEKELRKRGWNDWDWRSAKLEMIREYLLQMIAYRKSKGLVI